MKMMALLFSGLVMSLSTLCADVVVYRGTARIAGDLTTAGRLPRVIGIYVLVDFETRQYTNIGFWSKGRVKRFVGASSTPSDIDIAELTITGGRTATVLATGSSNSTDATTFNHNLVYFRGKNAELLIKKEPTSTRIARPRSLKGYALSLNSGTSTRAFSELTLALSYDQRATLVANNGGRTLVEASDDLEAKLANKGYEPFSP